MIVMQELVQGSREWLQERLGVLTASQVSELLTPTGKLSASRRRLIYRLVAEDALHEPVEVFGGTYWMERGIENEFESQKYFEFQTGLTAHAVGFVYLDEARQCGCSPDWMVRDDDGDWVAGAEVKNPKADTHVGYLLGGGQQYVQQVQFSLWVTGLPVWYFLSYHERLPPLLQRIEPEEKWQSAFDEHVPVFLDELLAAKNALQSMVGDGRGTGDDQLPLGF